jgi:hypothetical protein
MVRLVQQGILSISCVVHTCIHVVTSLVSRII